jgi:phycocyanobilin lyase alpha subunit
MLESVSENFASLSPTEPSAGDESLTVEQAIANLQGIDLGLRIYAAWWLGRFRVREAAAIAALIVALADEADRTPEGGYPLRRNAARALGKLGDRQAVPALLQCLDCSDFYVREAAAQSLGMLGDPVCVPALIDLLKVGLQGNQLVPQQPKLSQPDDAILEALGTLRATEAISLVNLFLDHPVERVQYSAARAMYQLTQEPIYAERLVQALAGKDLQLRRAVLADLGAIGYLPAAEAIAETLAENSLKLIALKGLLEHQANQTSLSCLSEDAVRVMNLMDSLL